MLSQQEKQKRSYNYKQLKLQIRQNNLSGINKTSDLSQIETIGSNLSAIGERLQQPPKRFAEYRLNPDRSLLYFLIQYIKCF